MDDPLIIFEVAVSSSSQIFTKFKRKRFLSDLWLTKQIRHLQNLFLQTVTINDIDIFGDLGSGNFKRQIPTNSLSLFVALLNFSSRSVPCNNFSNVKSEQHYRLRYRLPSQYQNINSVPDALPKIWNMLFYSQNLLRSGYIQIYIFPCFRSSHCDCWRS